MNLPTLRYPRPLAMVLIALTAVLGACDDTDATDRLSITPPSSTIGPAGGEIDLGGGVTLRIPAGAVAEPTEFGVRVVDSSAGVTDPYRAGSIYEFQPAGLSLALPAEVRIPNGGSGDGLLVVTLGTSNQIEGLYRGRVSGSSAQGGLERLGPVWVTQRGNVASRIDLQLAAHELQAGDVLSLDLRVFNAAGGLLNPASADVVSSAPEVASVEVQGDELVVTAKTEGVTTITASMDGVSASIIVTVTAGDIASLEIEPSAVNMARRDTVQLSVRAFDSEGNETDVPRGVLWSSADRQIVRVNSLGQVVAFASGSARIVARFGEAMAEALVTVDGPVPTSISISPERPSVGQGETRPLTATTFDELGLPIEQGAPAVTWSSEDESIATVNANGRVTGVELGETRIIATSADPAVGADTVTLVVGNGRIAGFQFTQVPERYAPGFALHVQPQLQLVDGFGNSVLRPGVTVTVSIRSGSGSLLGTLSVETDEQGTARFTDLGIDGDEPVTLEFSTVGLEDTSAVVTPMQPMELVFDGSCYSNFGVTLPISGFDDEEPIFVDWGDGTKETYGFGTLYVSDLIVSASSEHVVRVYGTATQFGDDQYRGDNDNWDGAALLIRVDAWGDLGLSSLNHAFYRAEALVSLPSTLPPGITNLFGTLSHATNFNQDVSNWDVSRVVTMEELFYYAESFNNGCDEDVHTCPLDWGDGTRNVRSMEAMFDEAHDFDQDINSWNVSRVQTFDDMFNSALAFNNGCADEDTSCAMTWGDDTRRVEDFSEMFEDTETFNQSVASFNVSSATRMDEMFKNSVFNNGCAEGVYSCPMPWGSQTASVTNMSEMFEDNVAFNQDVSSWNLSSVTTIEEMFEDATAFNNGCGDSTSCPLYWTTDGTSEGDPTTGSITTIYRVFEAATNFKQSVSTWDVSKVTNFAQAFQNVTEFNQDISDWDVSSATDMNSMFDGAAAFDQDLSGWDVSKVTDMSYMFLRAGSFDQDLSGWCVTLIGSEPANFSTDAILWGNSATGPDASGRATSSLYWGQPVWGTCPSTDD